MEAIRNNASDVSGRPVATSATPKALFALAIGDQRDDARHILALDGRAQACIKG
jgi:hypothetical protein